MHTKQKIATVLHGFPTTMRPCLALSWCTYEVYMCIFLSSQHNSRNNFIMIRKYIITVQQYRAAFKWVSTTMLLRLEILCWRYRQTPTILQNKHKEIRIITVLLCPPKKKYYVQIWLPRVPGQAVGRRREWEVDGDDKGSAGRDRGRCRGRTLHDGPAILGGGFSHWDDIFKV